MVEIIDRAISRTFNRLKQIGELRDGFLVGVVIVYILGYIVWAFNAWQNNLGLLPAIDFQYFIAGIVPTVLLLTLYIAIRGNILVHEKVPIWFGPSVTGWGRILRIIIFVVCGGSLLLWVLLDITTDRSESISLIFEPYVRPILYIWIVSLYFLPPVQKAQQSDETPKKFNSTNNNQLKSLLDRCTARLVSYKQDSKLFRPFRFILRIILRIIFAFLRFIIGLAVFLLALTNGVRDPSLNKVFRSIGSFYAFLFIIMLAVIGIAFFIEDVYPNIPQEFGGPQPRCAYLDVATAQLSNETRKAILPVNTISSDSRVVRSNKVDVFFLGSEFLMVKPSIENLGNESEIYEIRRSDVEVVIWCGD